MAYNMISVAYIKNLARSFCSLHIDLSNDVSQYCSFETFEWSVCQKIKILR